MAKRTNDEAFNDFLADVISTVPEDQRATVEGALKAEGASTKLRDGVLARAEFSRNMDDIASKRQAFDRDVSEARTRIAGWQEWYGTASQEHADLVEENRKLKAGDPVTRDAPDIDPAKFVSVEDFDSKVQQASQQANLAAMELAVTLTDLQNDHRDTYKEKLDTKALLQTAADSRISVPQAYEVLTADRKAEAFEKRVENARKEGHKAGEQEALARHRLPVLPGDAEPLPVDSLGVESVPRTPRDRISAALEGFNGLVNAPDQI